MILFINVFLDHNPADLLSSPLGMQYNRRNLPIRDKGEIFLYTLHSYRTIQWSKVIIYCEMNDLFPNQEEYYCKIKNIFPDCELYKKRNAYQNQWQEAINLLDGIEDDLIWYAGNHDHPYIAPNHDQLNALVEAMKNCDEKYMSAMYSHHPDVCARYMKYPNFEWKYESLLVSSCRINLTASALIVNKNLLKYWWFENDYSGKFMPRPDWKDGLNCESVKHKVFLNTKELCRHFDGHDFGAYSYDPNDIPPLDIPEGFWHNDIKIDYLTKERRNNYLWINPLVKNYFAVDPNGVDYKIFISDLPLFWKDKIKEINIGAEEKRDVRKERNRALINSANPVTYFMNELKNNTPTRARLPLFYVKGIIS